MHRALALVIPFCLLLPLGGQDRPPDRKERPIIFILDASGSMAETFDSESRMVAARKILREQLGRIDPHTPLGLVAYGNRIPGCRSHRLYSRVSAGNQATIAAQVERMVPAGATPLAATLKLVKRTLLPQHPDANIVIISDGAESCGGNPARIARELRAAHEDLNINVIGLQLKDAARRQLSAVAQAGQGRYYQVDRPADFARALQASTGLALGATPARPAADQSNPGGWHEPEEPYLVDPLAESPAAPAQPPPSSQPPGKPPAPPSPDRDPHESYQTFEHPAR